MKYLLLAAVLVSATALGQTKGFSDDTGLAGADPTTVAYNVRLNKAMLRYHNAWPACATDICRAREYAAWRNEITTAGSICFQVENAVAAVAAARTKGLSQSCVPPGLPPASTKPASSAASTTPASPAASTTPSPSPAAAKPALPPASTTPALPPAPTRRAPTSSTERK